MTTMRIVRPWAAEGDYFEIIIDDEVSIELPELSDDERLDATMRYVRARYAPSAATVDRDQVRYGLGYIYGQRLR